MFFCFFLNSIQISGKYQIEIIIYLNFVWQSALLFNLVFKFIFSFFKFFILQIFFLTFLNIIFLLWLSLYGKLTFKKKSTERVSRYVCLKINRRRFFIWHVGHVTRFHAKILCTENQFCFLLLLLSISLFLTIS